MPFVSKGELELIEERTQDMQEELDSYRALEPFLILAQDIRAKTTEMLEDAGSPLMTAQRLGQEAYNAVLARETEALIKEGLVELEEMAAKARKDLKKAFTKEVLEQIYQTVFETVREEEGASIETDVREALAADPETKIRMQKKARAELIKLVNAAIAEEIIAEQSAILEKEKARQIELSRLDVQFAQDHELNLESEEVKQLIQVGDRLEVHTTSGTSNKKVAITFTWTEDVNDKKGWVCTEQPPKLVQFSEGTTGKISKLTISSGQFARLGVLNKDLESGKDVVEQDVLVLGKQLAIIRPSGKQILPNYPKQNLYNAQPVGGYFMKIQAVKFKTKNLEFDR